MSENIFTNKYFVIALIILIIILLFLYIQSRSRRVEGMKNLDINNPTQTLAERPWEGGDDESGYKKVNNKFDRFVDTIINKEKRQQTPNKQDLLNRLIEEDAETIIITKRKNNSQTNIPQPFDSYSRYNECPPCVCPQDRYIADNDSEQKVYIYKK
ncbi:hypothetical protein H012_gp399 [Acanthamoeba polyphaga moumouvirus]|uniref:Uncharacterized protein n=1 Tax=Acanthamoeba polyphaga moumouvirus TaxID=1269028 RepID=L7RG93_9VIRU|nr:hypothetical protein H012_gp399 [Acanthamoeba polyphaga moumouvirus]AGC02060.1 hypothetical protein Moumou_00526 [Acanthamoeba polyphaga moumouvirus]AQN68426.1 hypothetical protein [Saudi moumouvirus]